MSDQFQTCFQLKNENPSLKNPVLANFTINDRSIEIDLNLFFSCSNFLQKIPKTENTKDLIEVFTQKYDEIIKKLSIHEDNSAKFLQILAGKETTLKNNNLFDIFKLAKCFYVPDLLNHLQKTCETITNTDEIFSILQKGKIAKEEEEYFFKFLNCGNMKKKLISNINECFSKFYFNPDFPANATFSILKRCEKLDSNSTEKLYQLIIQAFDVNFRLLPFLDYYCLSDQQKESLCKLFSDFVKNIEKGPSYLLENDLKLKEMKIFILKREIEELKTENQQLKEENIKINSKIKSLDFSESKQKRKELKSEINSNSQNDDYSEDEMSKNTELKQRNKELKRENEKLKNKIDQLRSKIASDTRTKDLSSDKTELKHQITTIQDENDDLKNENEEMQSEIDDLNHQIYELKQKVESLKTENKKLKSKSYNDEDSNTNRPILTKYKTYNDNFRHRLTEKNYERIRIFEENQKIITKGSYTISKYGQLNRIKEDFDYSVQNTKVITSTEPLLYDSKRKKCKHIDKSKIFKTIEVTHESTFASAIRMKETHKKVCVLNIASSTKPGGGVLNGRNAQEECLSRQSTLYFSLVEQKSFYDYNNLYYDSFGTDYMIYSPNVIILRDDDDKLIDPIKVSVISSVAVNYSELMQHFHHGEKDKKVYEVMKKRCRRILELCLSKGNDVIVLGAFGCGVFKNSPKVVSGIFKELLIEEAIGMEFKKIIFAVKTKPNESDDLFNAFKNSFLS